MQASNSLIPQPSPFACIVWELLKKETTFSLKELSSQNQGNFLLPIFGSLHGKRLVELLDGEAKTALQLKLQYQLKCIQEIIGEHIKKLISNSPVELATKSMYLNRTVYDYPPLERFMLQQIRETLALSSCPVPEARQHKLHRIPHYALEESSMGAFLDKIDEKNNQIITLILSWFAETTPNETSLTLTAEQWIECQMALLHLEAWPGVSFAEAILRWTQEIRPASQAQPLVQLWTDLCTFHTLLKTKQAKKFPCDAQGKVVFRRPQGLVLTKKETLQDYIVRFSQQVMLAKILKTVGQKLHNLNPDALSSSFSTSCEQIIRNEKYRESLLYFVEAMSESLARVPLKSLRPDPEALRFIFSYYYKFLKRLFSKEGVTTTERTVAFPLEAKPAYSFLLGVALFYHTVSLAPSTIQLEPSLLLEFLALSLEDKESLATSWKTYVKQETSTPCKLPDLTCLLNRFANGASERLQLLTAIIADSMRVYPPGASMHLEEHNQFIVQIETLTYLRLDQITGFFLLTALPLNKEMFQFFEQFNAFKVELQRAAKERPLYISSEIISRIEEWNILSLPRTLLPREELVDHPASAKLIGEITTLINYCLLPTCIGWSYCRFLSLVQIMAKPEENDFKHWQWAQLHNGALIELAPNLRAMRCEFSWLGDIGKKFQLSIQWVRSLDTLVTRQIRHTLSLENIPIHNNNVSYLAKLAWKLCQDRQPRDLALDQIPNELIEFCTLVKNDLTLAITDSSDPILQFNDKEQCFYLTSISLPLPLQVFQVRLVDYQRIFQQLLVSIQAKESKGIARVFTAVIWNRNALLEAPIDIFYEYKCTGCMGDGDDERKIIDKYFYRIVMRFSDFPGVQMSATYLAPPTAKLLGWQLALVKELYLTREVAMLS